MKGWTTGDLDRKKKAGTIRDYKLSKPEQKKSKRAKYGNKRVEWQGEFFDSKREYKDYRKLLLRLKAGEIGQLKRQVEFELNEGGTHSLIYRADFTYIEAATGEYVVQDSKGCLTATYKKKRRLMKKLFGITIKET